jgi:hypothetical protein
MSQARKEIIERMKSDLLRQVDYGGPERHPQADPRGSARKIPASL